VAARQNKCRGCSKNRLTNPEQSKKAIETATPSRKDQPQMDDDPENTTDLARGKASGGNDRGTPVWERGAELTTADGRCVEPSFPGDELGTPPHTMAGKANVIGRRALKSCSAGRSAGSLSVETAGEAFAPERSGWSSRGSETGFRRRICGLPGGDTGHFLTGCDPRRTGGHRFRRTLRDRARRKRSCGGAE
jgi:hypothetical protein